MDTYSQVKINTIILSLKLNSLGNVCDVEQDVCQEETQKEAVCKLPLSHYHINHCGLVVKRSHWCFTANKRKLCLHSVFLTKMQCVCSQGLPDVSLNQTRTYVHTVTSFGLSRKN